MKRALVASVFLAATIAPSAIAFGDPLPDGRHPPSHLMQLRPAGVTHAAALANIKSFTLAEKRLRYARAIGGAGGIAGGGGGIAGGPPKPIQLETAVTFTARRPYIDDKTLLTLWGGAADPRNLVGAPEGYFYLPGDGGPNWYGYSGVTIDFVAADGRVYLLDCAMDGTIDGYYTDGKTFANGATSFADGHFIMVVPKQPAGTLMAIFLTRRAPTARAIRSCELVPTIIP